MIETLQLSCACGGVGEFAILAWLGGSVGAWILLVKTKVFQSGPFRWMKL